MSASIETSELKFPSSHDDSSAPSTSGGTAPRSQGNGATTGDSAMNMDRVVRGAHATIDKLADKAGPEIDHLKQRWQAASESMHERVDALVRSERQMVDSCRSVVREHPLTSLAIALAAGLLIARMNSSR